MPECPENTTKIPAPSLDPWEEPGYLCLAVQIDSLQPPAFLRLQAPDLRPGGRYASRGPCLAEVDPGQSVNVFLPPLPGHRGLNPQIQKGRMGPQLEHIRGTDSDMLGHGHVFIRSRQDRTPREAAEFDAPPI